MPRGFEIILGPVGEFIVLFCDGKGKGDVADEYVVATAAFAASWQQRRLCVEQGQPLG